MDCLDNIIGLSQSECACLGEKPEDYDLSHSGVFVDQLDGFNIDMAMAADDCARDGIWIRMERAVKNAKQDLTRDLLGCIGQNYKPRIQNYAGQLGDSQFSGSLNLSDNYAGVRILPLQIKGAYLTLKKIGVLVNTSTNVTVSVYSNENTSTLLYTSTPIPAVANTLTWASLATPLELPLFSFNTSIRYYVVMHLDGTFQPKANKKECGCSGTQRPWLRWLDYEGARGADVANPQNFTGTSELNGITLDVEVKCKTAEVICSSEKPLDFTNDSDALYLAYALRFRAGAKVYEELISTTKLNRYSLLNQPDMQRRIQEWNTGYMDCVNYLCSRADTNIGVNDCLVCRDKETTLIRTPNIITG